MPARSLPSAIRAPLLLLVLAITTGWTGVAAAQGRVPNAPAAGASALESAAGPASSDSGSTGSSAVVARRELEAGTPAPPVSPGLVDVNTATEPERSEIAAAQPVFSGRNRFWMPSLDINRKVRPFACSRQRAPGDRIYRWGCAGTNNVYVMGHADSVMKPLHDAYVRGKLRVGMLAAYANSNGDVTRYRVSEWRVVDPADASWAIADQPVQSMTIQTCVGKGWRYRLLVRLIAVD